jgi:FKBP-type peptidyl-prolyl cis-trans isomerase 2
MKYRSLIKFAIICFIIYAVYTGNSSLIQDWAKKTSNTISSLKEKPTKPTISKDNNDKPSEKQGAGLKFAPEDEDSIISNITVNFLNKVLDNPNGRLIFEEIANKAIQQQQGIFGDDIANKTYIAKDLTLGVGDKVQCGEKVEIEYNVSESNAISAQPNNIPVKAKETLIIGRNKNNKNLENGIIGMKKGGTRKIIFVNQNAKKQNGKSSYLVADVTLVDFKPGADNINTKVFIEKEDYPGQIFGSKIMCGDEVESYYTLYDVKGKILYDSKKENKKIKFIIGDKKTPKAISSGLVGLTENKTKITLIAKPSDLHYTDNKNHKLIPSNINAPQGQLIILEIDTTF